MGDDNTYFFFSCSKFNYFFVPLFSLFFVKLIKSFVPICPKIGFELSLDKIKSVFFTILSYDDIDIIWTRLQTRQNIPSFK